MLLSSTFCDAQIAENNRQELLQDAQKQQQLLLDKHGLSQQPIWQEKCHSMMQSLALKHFSSCQVLAASHANAYSLAHGVVLLTEGLLANINNDDQLAHVLAHEHAHLTLNHHLQAKQRVNNPPTFFTKSRLKKFYRQIEQEADEAADQWLIEHQLDSLQIHHYLLRIEQTTAERSSDHKKLKQRIKRTGLPAEIIDPWWSAMKQD